MVDAPEIYINTNANLPPPPADKVAEVNIGDRVDPVKNVLGQELGVNENAFVSIYKAQLTNEDNLASFGVSVGGENNVSSVFSVDFKHLDDYDTSQGTDFDKMLDSITDAQWIQLEDGDLAMNMIVSYGNGNTSVGYFLEDADGKWIVPTNSDEQIEIVPLPGHELSLVPVIKDNSEALKEAFPNLAFTDGEVMVDSYNGKIIGLIDVNGGLLTASVAGVATPPPLPINEGIDQSDGSENVDTSTSTNNEYVGPSKPLSEMNLEDWQTLYGEQILVTPPAPYEFPDASTANVKYTQYYFVGAENNVLYFLYRSKDGALNSYTVEGPVYLHQTPNAAIIDTLKSDEQINGQFWDAAKGPQQYYTFVTTQGGPKETHMYIGGLHP